MTQGRNDVRVFTDERRDGRITFTVKLVGWKLDQALELGQLLTAVPTPDAIRVGRTITAAVDRILTHRSRHR